MSETIGWVRWLKFRSWFLDCKKQGKKKTLFQFQVSSFRGNSSLLESPCKITKSYVKYTVENIYEEEKSKAHIGYDGDGDEEET